MNVSDGGQQDVPQYGTEAYERWHQANFGAPAPQPAPQPKKKRHPIRWTLAVLVVGGVVAGIAAAANSGGGGKHPAAAASSSASPTQTPDATATHQAASGPDSAPDSPEYQKYVELSRQAGYPAVGEGTVKGTADSVCKLDTSDLTTLLRNENDKDSRALTGIIIRAYCPASYSGFQAAQAALAPKPSPKPKPKPSVTASEQQAIASANSYLQLGTGFSRAGLIDQLSSQYGEGFSTADATYAVDHVTVDWNQQALDSAKGYLKLGTGFSRASLIDQLTSAYGEKFTLAQATYAADQLGLK